MTIKLYIGNLSYSTLERDIYDLVEEFGKVYSVKMVNDPETGRFRGFCYVEMDEPAGFSVMEELDGKEFNGRYLRIKEARSV